MIAVGTRLGDFTTASRTAFQNPDVRFIAINVAEFDAHKLGALPLVGDARAALEALRGGARRAPGRPGACRAGRAARTASGTPRSARLYAGEAAAAVTPGRR